MHMNYLDMKELDKLEEPVLMSTLIRPCYRPEPRDHVCNDTTFPQMEPRSVREPGEMPEEGMYTSNILCIKVVSQYPPPPPPQPAKTMELHVERLNVVADLASWVPFMDFIIENVDVRCITGEWGPEVKGYAMLQLESGGVMDITMQSEGFTIMIPPSVHNTAGLSCGAFFELSCSKASLAITPSLPASLLDGPDFLDPALNKQGSGIPLYGEGPDCTYLAPFRCRAEAMDVTLSGPFLTEEAQRITLVEPMSVSFLVSIDSLEPPREGSPCDGHYLPFDDNAILNVSVGLSAVDVLAHLPAWITFVDVLFAQAEAFNRRRPLPRELSPTVYQPPTSTPLAPLQGADLHAVFKVCALKVCLCTAQTKQATKRFSSRTDITLSSYYSHVRS